MKLKIDENLPVEAAALLQRAGHDATTVVSEQLSGADDPELMSVCQTQGRVLVTLDVGFADIRAYPPLESAGLIVLRLRLQDKAHVLDVLGRLTRVLAAENPSGQLWIVDEERVRIRG